MSAGHEAADVRHVIDQRLGALDERIRRAEPPEDTRRLLVGHARPVVPPDVHHQEVLAVSLERGHDDAGAVLGLDPEDAVVVVLALRERPALGRPLR